MTLTAPSPAGASSGTSASPTGAALWRRFRLPLALLLALVLVAAVLGVLTSTERGSLDPRSFSPGGGRATAALLEEQGVRTTVVTDLEQLSRAVSASSTVLVPQTAELFTGELEQVGRLARDAGAALVVGGADDSDLQELDLPAVALGGVEARDREPSCDLPYAVAAGRARSGAVAYAAQGGIGCYPDGGDPTLVVLDGGRVTVVGSVAPLTNDRLDQQGNARLALGLLGERQDGGRTTEVLWLVPRPDRPVPEDATRTLGDLVPRGLLWGALQVAIAVAVLALWRGRRLGRVVREPLPVVVRGAEAVEGRARLYRAAGARDRAAEALRAGTRDRLARALRLPPDTGREVLVQALAERSGRDPYAVDALLFGPAPDDDEALVRLADQLDALRPDGDPTHDPTHDLTPDREAPAP